MKFKVTMKDPDTLYDAIHEAVKEQVEDLARESRKNKIGTLCGQWFEWGEYLTVEIDTDAKTCTVVEVSR